MRTVYVLIGAPGSGKSTWARDNASRLGAVVVSADVVRSDMRSHGQDPRDGDAVFAEVERRTRDLLVADQSVILDATHYRHKYRTYAIELARKLGTRCVAVWLDVPLDIALHRNLRRTGHLYGDLPVTSRVVRSIHRQLEPPEADEFDEVVRVSQFPGRR